MKSFFSTVLAVFTALIAIFFLGIGLLIAVAASSDGEAPKIKENSLLKISLSGPLNERVIDDPFAELNGALLGNEDAGALGLNDLMLGLEKAASDDNISGILLEQGAFGAGYGALEELAEYLTEFKESGKPIYSYGEYYTQKGAFLATLADTVYLHPNGIMDIRGIGISSTYYKEFFEKVGIEPLVVRGTGNNFKSAVEPYLANEMSEENRLQLSELTSQFWSFLSDGFERRGIMQSDLDSAANNWLGMDADAMKAIGMVDELGYRESIMEELEDRFEIVKWDSYASTIEQQKASDRIAVIYANGTIGNGAGDEGSIGTKNIIKALKKADKNKKVKAIVLRVNSPGGSALTSDMIHNTIEELEKPIVVSQGNYAASGGYYISCNADAIFSNSTTVTGSIGIFMSLFTAESLMAETLGLHVEEVQTHDLANFPNLYKHPNEQQYAILQRMIDRGYDDFTGKVAAGRDTTMEYVKSVGGGRVWTGTDALRIGLADQEGNLKDAIAYAAELTELEEYRLYELPIQQTGLERYMSSLSTSIKGLGTTTIGNPMLNHPAIQELIFLAQNPGMQAKLHPAFSQF